MVRSSKQWAVEWAVGSGGKSARGRDQQKSAKGSAGHKTCCCNPVLRLIWLEFWLRLGLADAFSKKAAELHCCLHDISAYADPA